MAKILYVDQNPKDYSAEHRFEYYELQRFILNGLKKNYDARLVHDLHSREVDIALRDNYDILLTHFPFKKINFDSSSSGTVVYGYEPAMQRLESIIKNDKKLKVIVYTGALPEVVSDKMLLSIGVLRILRKTEDVAKDLKKIEKYLDNIL